MTNIWPRPTIRSIMCIFVCCMEFLPTKFILLYEYTKLCYVHACMWIHIIVLNPCIWVQVHACMVLLLSCPDAKLTIRMNSKIMFVYNMACNSIGTHSKLVTFLRAHI